MEKCSKCEIAPFCGGGCPFASISVKHDINDPVCDDAKEVFSDYIDSIKDTYNETGEKYERIFFPVFLCYM